MKQFAPLIYVAGCYAAQAPQGILDNIAKAEAVSIALIRNGWHVFTPHKNTSGYEQYEDGTITHGTWLDLDLNVLARCDALYVLDNWRESTGTQLEIRFADEHSIPRFYQETYPANELSVDEMYNG